eukprot:TRINITY_DN13701_c0_g1_i2.p1 TRINITY_DN13701_c0_g1~~TRINITY_DN13701_c0_g1_i2.p1  ORF type:complete len:590 (-),score=105.87 TRINITY_DN13701_c0_g1_i2:149-1873(-)
MASADMEQLQAALNREWAMLRLTMDEVQERHTGLIQSAFSNALAKSVYPEVQAEEKEDGTTTSKTIAVPDRHGYASQCAARTALGESSEAPCRSADLGEVSKSCPEEDEEIEDLEDWLNVPLEKDGSVQSSFKNTLLHYLKRFHDLEEPERTGWLARAVDSNVFEQICSLVICANIVNLVLWTDKQVHLLTAGITVSKEDTAIHDLVDNGFVAFYTVEILLKMMVHRAFFFIGDNWGWNCFDLLLVALSLQELLTSLALGGRASNFGFLKLFKSVKLAKILRVAKVLRVFKELSLMLSSLIGSMRSLFWSLLMMAFIYFAFSLLFVRLSFEYLAENIDFIQESDRKELIRYFGSVANGMFTLFAGSTGSDWTLAYGCIEKLGSGSIACYLFFVAFVNISFMNIVTGLFIEKAMKLAQPDLDAQALEEYREETSWAEEMRSIAKEFIGVNSDGALTKAEFAKFVRHPLMRAKFTVLGVTINDAKMFYNMLAAAINSSDGTVPLESFVDGCLRLRGAATSIDLQTLAFKFHKIQDSQQEFRARSLKLMEQILESVSFHSTHRTHAEIASPGMRATL